MRPKTLGIRGLELDSILIYSAVNFSYYPLQDKFINPNNLSGFDILKSYLFSLSQVLLSSIYASINYISLKL